MAIIDSNNCIPSGLRVDIMRHSMENKNLLSAKGSIYVGTGETVTVGGEKIYKTRALVPGSVNTILQVKNGDLGYDTIRDVTINSSVNYTNLNYTLNNLKLINSQFNSSSEYTNLKITDQNFDADQKSTITTNIRIIKSEGTSCALMQGGSVSRSIELAQDAFGKFLLSYKGGDSGLYLHKLTLRLTWPNSEQVSGFMVTYLSFSFINNESGDYEITNDSSLTTLLKALIGSRVISGNTSYTGFLAPSSVTPGVESVYRYFDTFKVESQTNSAYLGIRVYYYYNLVWVQTKILGYSSSFYAITSQSTTALVEG